MRRTSIGDIAVPFAVIGVTAYVLLRVSYGSIPPLQLYVPIPIAILGVAELAAARRVRAVLRHDPDAKPMTAIEIARCVALGKASALVAAGVAGAAVALLVRVIPDVGTVRAAAGDLRVGIFLLLAGLVLLLAGVLLERAGIDPNRGSPPTAGT
jgi:hypothetical protein